MNNEYYDDHKAYGFYYLNNQKHRVNGPAGIWKDGHKEWWIHGQLHREDGPAIECRDGTKYWYLHGKMVECNSQEEFERLIKLKSFW